MDHHTDMLSGCAEPDVLPVSSSSKLELSKFVLWVKEKKIMIRSFKCAPVYMAIAAWPVRSRSFVQWQPAIFWRARSYSLVNRDHQAARGRGSCPQLMSESSGTCQPEGAEARAPGAPQCDVLVKPGPPAVSPRHGTGT
jgi:hypothetical protein